jgi:ectoine hydroxylase-related dioxygenase (phytanoyl-CoA dioxygenase family)
MSDTALSSTPFTLTREQVDFYRINGFVHVPAVLSAEAVARYREAADRQYQEAEGYNASSAASSRVFKQILQLWKSDPVLRELTFNEDIASIATQLAGVPLRLWHDQLLVKAPHNHAATEYHQDGPYWPHDNSRHSLSAWIALVDVPVERGCMTFIPRQQNRQGIRAVNLLDKTDMFLASPDLTWQPRVTIPLRAGDITVHNSFTPHTANANDTDEYRLAQVNIYADADLNFNGKPHPVTDPLGLAIGAKLPDGEFPRVPR